MNKYLNPADVAKDLGLAVRSVQRYCHEGFLPAEATVKNNRVYFLIDPQDYQAWKLLHFSGPKRDQTTPKLTKNNSACKSLGKSEIKAECVAVWLEWLKAGKFGNKPVGPRTLELYEYYFGMFLNILPPRPTHPIVSVDNFRVMLEHIPAEKFATRRHIYDAVMSIAKYLVEIKELDEAEREKIRKLRPKRYLPPHRPCLTERQFNRVVAETDISRSGNQSYDRLLNRTLLIFMAHTGLRASEVSKLVIKDVDFDERIVYVWLGKMQKNRRVGITNECLKVLEVYLQARLKKFGTNNESFFLNGLGTALDRKSMSQKFRRLSRHLDFSLSPHMLRRYFVTSNVNRGVSLVFLQIMAGHADITTTRSYCRTSEDEVLEAMRGW